MFLMHTSCFGPCSPCEEHGQDKGPQQRPKQQGKAPSKGVQKKQAQKKSKQKGKPSSSGELVMCVRKPRVRTGYELMH